MTIISSVFLFFSRICEPFEINYGHSAMLLTCLVALRDISYCWNGFFFLLAIGCFSVLFCVVRPCLHCVYVLEQGYPCAVHEWRRDGATWNSVPNSHFSLHATCFGALFKHCYWCALKRCVDCVSKLGKSEFCFVLFFSQNS